MASIDRTETVRAGDLEAVVAPAKGMTIVSLRHGGDELLGRERAVADPVLREAMAGIPLLHPWANRLSGERYAFAGREALVPAGASFVPRDGEGRPIHGLIAPPGAWQVSPRAGDDRLHAVMDFGADPERAAAFPFPHRLALDVAAGTDRLTVTATLTATGDVAVPVVFGFHPYLRLPRSRRAEWTIELPPMRPLGARAPRPGQATRLADATIDAGFADVADGASFALRDRDRRIALRHDSGFPAAQVYAPAAEDVVCFEPMAAPAGALSAGTGFASVEPGESYRAAFTVLVSG